MTRYLLDTGVAGDYVFRRAGVRERCMKLVAAGHRIGIGIPTLGELWGGIEHSKSAEPNRQKLRIALSDLYIWPFEKATAETFGKVYGNLRRIGRLIQQIDMQLAAIALHMNLTVVTKDSDFAAVPGLAIEDWSQPETMG